MGILEFQDEPGLGDDEYPGFPADDCPIELPDLSGHHSVLVDALKKSPGLYTTLRGRRTHLGVGLARCIKTGMDNRGHPMIKALGLVAGDGECYECFRELFDVVLQQSHVGSPLLSPHPTEKIDLGRLQRSADESFARYVLSSQVHVSRSFEGVRFPTAMTLDERLQVERLTVQALSELAGPLEGEYFPLAGSQSYAAKPGGMSRQQEEELLRARLLFEQPDSSIALSSGVGRHWPHGRGVFLSGSRRFAAWVNEEDHLCLRSARLGVAAGGVQEAFAEVMGALDCINSSVSRQGELCMGFARSERLGYLTACPSKLGTALRVVVMLRLPLLSLQDGLAKWCSRSRSLTVREAFDDHGRPLVGCLEVTHRGRLGVSEIATMNGVVAAVDELIRMERYLEQGGLQLQVEVPSVDALASLVARDMSGVVDKEVVDKRPVSPCYSDADDEEVDWSTSGRTLGLLVASAIEMLPAPAPVAPVAAPISRPAAPIGSAQPAAPVRPAPTRRTPSKEQQERQRKQQQLREQQEPASPGRRPKPARGAPGEDFDWEWEPVKPDSVEAVATACAAVVCPDAPAAQAAATSASAAKIQAVHRGKQARKEMREKATERLGNEAKQDTGQRQQEPARKAPSPEISKVREETRSMLEQALQSGRLEQVLAAEAQESFPSGGSRPEVAAPNSREATGMGTSITEGIRLRMKSVLEEALSNGALAHVFSGQAGDIGGMNLTAQQTPADLAPRKDIIEENPNGVCLDEVMRQVSIGLLESFESGRLEGWLKTGGLGSGEAAAGSVAKNLCADFSDTGSFQASPLALLPPLPPTADIRGPALKVLGNNDRRLGAMTVLVEVTRKRIAEADALAARMEADITSTYDEARRLDDEIEVRQKQIDEQEQRQMKLEEAQRQLSEDLFGEALKLRHAAVDLDPSMTPNFDRSDMSTACSMREHAESPSAVPPMLVSQQHVATAAAKKAASA
jgi:creatine kinase